MVDFVTQNRPNFDEKLICGHKSETIMWFMKLKIAMNDKYHRYSKHTMFHQNLMGPYNVLVIGHGMTQN